MMNGTTFPGPGGEHGGQQSSGHGGYGGGDRPSYGGGGGYNQGGNSYGGGNGGGNGGGYQKKPWENRNGGGNGGGNYEKKPWNGEKKPFQRPVETDMSFYKPYAVAGNKDIPQEILAKMIASVQKLEKLDYTMRCGGTEGLEEAIENAVTGKKEIHLPFRDFNQKQSKFTYVSDRAKAVAKMFYPNWDVMKPGAQLFLAKNARVLMGQRVDSPALFFLCWTEDGVESKRDVTNRTGFTGHPIAIASALGIPIFNFGNPSAEQRLSLYLESLQQS